MDAQGKSVGRLTIYFTTPGTNSLKRASTAIPVASIMTIWNRITPKGYWVTLAFVMKMRRKK